MPGLVLPPEQIGAVLLQLVTAGRSRVAATTTRRYLSKQSAFGELARAIRLAMTDPTDP